MTRVDLVTGFLGAGKTTFITNFARWLKGRGLSVAVLENEFGISGTDGAVLKEIGLDVTELSGGCICCALKTGFVTALVELSQKYSEIIVEPSGIFAMDDFFDVMRSAQVAAVCEVGFVITVVDPNILDELSTQAMDVLASQLHSTGMVVLSMSQKLTETQIADACERISNIYSSVCIDAASELLFKVLPWNLYTDGDFEDIVASKPRCNLHTVARIDHATIFNSARIRPQKNFLSDEIAQKLAILMNDAAYGEILRIKGNVPASGGGQLLINCTASSITVSEKRSLETPSTTPCVNIIGKQLNRKRINELLNSQLAVD